MKDEGGRMKDEREGDERVMTNKDIRIETLRQIQRMPRLDNNVASDEELEQIIMQIEKETTNEPA